MWKKIKKLGFSCNLDSILSYYLYITLIYAEASAFKYIIVIRLKKLAIAQFYK
jgi:hypothetical protein